MTTLPALVALVAWLLLPLADRVPTLAPGASVAPRVAAMPTIADPASAAERRINAALRQLDDRVRKVAAACRASATPHADWERTVQTTMRGPHYLSLLITDDYYCDSAYPNHTIETITYDLATGDPVDWTKLLPRTLTGKVALEEQADGTRMVTLASATLMALYKARYQPPAGLRALCQQSITDLGNDATPMMPWLDAKAAGLAVQFELPHVAEACATPVVIPATTLRRAGASPRLLAALAAR